MCGHDRGNGAPVPEGAIGASMHPLGVHKYAGGVQSCANRLLLKSVRAAAAPIVTALGNFDTLRARLRHSSLDSALRRPAPAPGIG